MPVIKSRNRQSADSLSPTAASRSATPSASTPPPSTRASTRATPNKFLPDWVEPEPTAPVPGVNGFALGVLPPPQYAAKNRKGLKIAFNKKGVTSSPAPIDLDLGDGGMTPVHTVDQGESSGAQAKISGSKPVKARRQTKRALVDDKASRPVSLVSESENSDGALHAAYDPSSGSDNDENDDNAERSKSSLKSRRKDKESSASDGTLEDIDDGDEEILTVSGSSSPPNKILISKAKPPHHMNGYTTATVDTNDATKIKLKFQKTFDDYFVKSSVEREKPAPKSYYTSMESTTLPLPALKFRHSAQSALYDNVTDNNKASQSKRQRGFQMTMPLTPDNYSKKPRGRVPVTNDLDGNSRTTPVSGSDEQGSRSRSGTLSSSIPEPPASSSQTLPSEATASKLTSSRESSEDTPNLSKTKTPRAEKNRAAEDVIEVAGESKKRAAAEATPPPEGRKRPKRVKIS